jgi:peptidoglycan/xylan/chitin deacetylase (PgdA/CDA1 family)
MIDAGDMQTTSNKLKVGILTGSDSEATCLSISALIRVPGIEVRGILLDTERATFRRRLRNLKRNIKREGISYLWFRFGEAIYDRVEGWAASLTPLEQVDQLLAESFPDHAFYLRDFSRTHSIPVVEVGNINSPKAAETLELLDVDLGIVLGTRVLKRSTFSVPRLGCINLHKGKVPEYRGQPAGFWEIYDGQTEAGITVHYVDDGLDTGDVIAETLVTIHPKDTPETLRTKLDRRGGELLAATAKQIADGRAARRPQLKSAHKTRTSPTRRERLRVARKAGVSTKEPSPVLHVFKTLLYLCLYHTGIYRMVRVGHQRFSSRRACILLYHRVNNFCRDPLTTSVKRFAEHLAMIRALYPVISTSRLLEHLRNNQQSSATHVAIHFDDCYRDVYTNAAPLLARDETPACVFISSGYIDTDRAFPHDLEKCPFRLENLRSEEVGGFVRKGIEVGAHTVNHVDLGKVPLDEAVSELTQSKRDLEAILKCPVSVMSFPYGRKENIRPEVVDAVRQAGYSAMFSAYGGFVEEGDDVFDLRRVGISGAHRPLDLLMDIEGLALGAWKIRRESPNRE